MSGVEWLVEAFGCSESSLTGVESLQSLFDRLIRELPLAPIGDPSWHRFPNTGGITGVWMLRESHLAIHTFPEFGSACINLFCCTRHGCPEWKSLMEESLGAQEVSVREFSRNYRGHA